jgi:outer membrane protein insertion porin family
MMTLHLCLGRRILLSLLAVMATGVVAATAQAPAPAPAAGQPAAASPLPPPGSPPLVRFIELSFPTQGNASGIEPETYLYYIQTKPSSPSAGRWEPYDEQTVLGDFHRLWNTNFLDDLKVDVKDAPYDNGVIGKHITYIMEERERIKVVDYQGTKVVQQSKIDEALRDKGIQIRLDSFIDKGLVNRVAGVVRDMMAEKGYQSATVKPEIVAMPGGPKLVHLTFRIIEGPKVRIAGVRFVGNEAFGNGALTRQMKNNKGPGFWEKLFFAKGGTYQEAKFEEDAERVSQYYRDHGYIEVRIGQPQLDKLRDSSDGKSRLMELRIPVTEGRQYRIGDFAFDGNKVVRSEHLRTLFKQRTGDVYNEKRMRDGLQKAREIYGAAGYFEFTGYPDLQPMESPEEGTAPRGRRPTGPLVGVTVRLQEGKRYFVNRILFTGNMTTRDDVIRREVRLFEGGVFDTEALKNSVKRLNQLGYFKQIEEQKGIGIEKTPGVDDRVDLTLKLEEQNRNQLTFGAGMSQLEGVFGQLAFETANFMGRGESLTLSLQRGARANNYEIALTEPYLLGRPISGSAAVYSRKTNYLESTNVVGYSEVREGTTVSLGKPLRRFSRIFLGYTYEVIDVAISESLLAQSNTTTAGTNALAPGMPLFGATDQGRHVDSRISPTFVRDTVDSPMASHSGKRLTTSVQVAGEFLGGTYSYWKPDIEGILYLPTSRRTGFGFRAQTGWFRTYGATTVLPYYFRYFLGGEYQIRGVDIRTVGPVDAYNRALGGNKFVLFNAEYYIDVAGPVRVLGFHDAGQAYLEGKSIDLSQLRTSTGVEVRVVVPMLNIPFRLIYAWNFLRDTYQPSRAFKFAVGTTF